MSRGPRRTSTILGALLAPVVVAVGTVPAGAVEDSAAPAGQLAETVEHVELPETIEHVDTVESVESVEMTLEMVEETLAVEGTFEVIVSDDVAPGEAPEFDVVETDVDGLLEILDEADPDERVELHGEARLAWTPTDPEYHRQWGHHLADLERAWDVTRGDGDIVIAVLDTGVEPHPDLVGRLLSGTSMVDGDPHDDTAGHGTSVALVAAAAHDQLGTAGVCPGCSILPVQVATPTGSVPWAAAADGVVWAVDQGADVVNLSFGGAGAPAIMEQAIEYALANDVVVVAAAGNDGHEQAFYPAAFEGVIAVGAHDDSVARYQWSNHGPWVDVSGPGCAPEPGVTVCGTSFASPWISGVVGLLAAALGDIDGPTAEALLEMAAAKLEWVETGWVDAGAAVGGQFADVDPAAYYADPIAWLAAEGITTGTSPTTYSPDAPVTRGQLATFLWRLQGSPDNPDATTATAFNDVDPTTYYASPIAWLAAEGITTGTSPTTYSPSAPVTRGQLATFLWRLHA